MRPVDGHEESPHPGHGPKPVVCQPAVSRRQRLHVLLGAAEPSAGPVFLLEQVAEEAKAAFALPDLHVVDAGGRQDREVEEAERCRAAAHGTVLAEEM